MTIIDAPVGHSTVEKIIVNPSGSRYLSHVIQDDSRIVKLSIASFYSSIKSVMFILFTIQFSKLNSVLQMFEDERKFRTVILASRYRRENLSLSTDFRKEITVK